MSSSNPQQPSDNNSSRRELHGASATTRTSNPTTAASLSNFIEQSWDKQLNKSGAATVSGDNRSRSRESRSSRSVQGGSITPSQSRRTRSTKSSSSAQHSSSASLQHSPTPGNERVRSKKSIKKSTKERREHTLSLFMQKEEAARPSAETEEMLEVRSAYTSMSRARKEKPSTSSRRKQHNRTGSGKLSSSASVQGDELNSRLNTSKSMNNRERLRRGRRHSNETESRKAALRGKEYDDNFTRLNQSLSALRGEEKNSRHSSIGKRDSNGSGIRHTKEKVSRMSKSSSALHVDTMSDSSTRKIIRKARSRRQSNEESVGSNADDNDSNFVRLNESLPVLQEDANIPRKSTTTDGSSTLSITNRGLDDSKDLTSSLKTDTETDDNDNCGRLNQSLSALQPQEEVRKIKPARSRRHSNESSGWGDVRIRRESNESNDSSVEARNSRKYTNKTASEDQGNFDRLNQSLPAIRQETKKVKVKPKKDQRIDPYNFARLNQSLSALQQDSKKEKKEKAKSSKKSISTAELSSFLEQCNAKKDRSLSGDRSFASMPAITDGKKYKKSSSKRSQSRRSSQRSVQSNDSSSQREANSVSGLGQSKELKVREPSVTKKMNGSTTKTYENYDSLLEESLSEARERSKSFSKDLKGESVRGGQQLQPSLSPNHQNSIINKTSDTLNNDRSQVTQESTTANRPVPTRSKDLPKLFSIRDLRIDEAKQAAATASKSDATPSTPVASRNFLGESSSSSIGLTPPPKTPSNQQLSEDLITADDSLMMTPPPPLAPMTPLDNNRNRRKISTKSGNRLRIPRRNRRASTSSANVSDSKEGNVSGTRRQPRRHSSHGSSDSLKTSTKPPAQPIKSILKNRDEVVLVLDDASNNNDAEEPETKYQKDFYDEEDRHAALNKAEAELGIEEDVFSHYSWSSKHSAMPLPTEETKLVRKQMKDAIRMSALYKVFEVIDKM